MTVDVEMEVAAMLAQARELHDESRYTEAGQLCEKAWHLARRHGLTAQAQEAGLRAARSFALSSQDNRALALYLEVLEDDPTQPVSPKQFDAYGWLVAILLDRRP